MSSSASPDPRDAIFDTSKIMKNLGSRAGKASVAMLALSGLRTLQQIGSIAIIGRLVPPEEYAIYALAVPGVMLALALSNFGLPQAVIQRKEIRHWEVSTLFWLNVAFSCVAALALVLLAYPAADIFEEPKVRPVFQAVAISVIFSALAGQYTAIMRRTLRARTAENVLLAAECLGVVVAVSAALMGLSYWALVLQQLAVPLMTLLGLVLVTRWMPSRPPGLEQLRGAFSSIKFGGFVAGASILNRFTEYSGTLVSGVRFDNDAIALFYRARVLARMPINKVMLPLGATFIPAFSRLQDDPEGTRALYIRMISRSNLLILPVAILMAVGAEPLTVVLLGQNWAEMAPLLFLLSGFTLRAGCNNGLQYAMISSGRGRELFMQSGIRLVCVATAVWIGSGYGLIAMAAAYSLVELFVTLPILAVLAVRYTVTTWDMIWHASVLPMLFAVAVGAVLFLGLNPLIDGLPHIVQLMAIGAALAVIYGIRILIAPDLRADALRAARALVPGRLRAKLGM